MIKDESYDMPTTREEWAESLMPLKELEEEDFPMKPSLIAEEQQKHREWRALRNRTEGCELKLIEGVHVWTLGGKIYVPRSLRGRIIGWYHEYLQHPGQNRMEASIKQTLW